MMRYRRRAPLGAVTLRDVIEEFLGQRFMERPLFPGRAGTVTHEQWVPVNIFELPEGVMVIAPMPGLQAEDVELAIDGNILTIHGRRTPGQEDRDYLVKEWGYGPYSRTVELPFPIDTAHIIATLDNGVLTVNMRKAESAIPKKIQVRSAAQRDLTGGETHASPQGLEREKASRGGR